MSSSESKALIAEIRTALAHLDDPVYLESLPLAREMGSLSQTPDHRKGEALQRLLRLAIGALDPGASRSGPAADVSTYQVLYRYAISKQSMFVIAGKIGVSERQAYRVLYRGIEALVQILHDLGGQSEKGEKVIIGDSLDGASRVRTELNRLSGLDEQRVDLDSLIEGSIQSAQPLALKQNAQIRLCNEMLGSGPHVAANRVMLRQAIINLLSHALSVNQGTEILIRLQCFAEYASVQIVCLSNGEPGLAEPQSPYAIASQLLTNLGLSWGQTTEPNGTICIGVRLPLIQPYEILIVDDNEGIIALFKRYLRHQPYRVHGVSSAEQAAERLKELRPAVIILDIMLPDQDGWEVLQAIRAIESGQEARVIVCSIINDPELAAALGADAFLLKPVSRADLLETLQRVLADSI